MKYHSLSGHEVPQTWQTEAILPDQNAALKRMAINGLTLRCLIAGDETQAVSVRSNCHVPADLAMYYYEVRILNKVSRLMGVTSMPTRLMDWVPCDFRVRTARLRSGFRQMEQKSMTSFLDGLPIRTATMAMMASSSMAGTDAPAPCTPSPV
jgi:hypothetical protein